MVKKSARKVKKAVAHKEMRPRMGRATTHELAALVIRFALGIVFVAHGAMKLFSVGVVGVGQFMGSLGVPAPFAAGVLISVLEFGGGLLLILGLFTRWAALLFAIEMFFAWVLVHAQNGFFITPGAYGYEFVLTLLLVSIGVFFHGAGLFSLEKAVFGHEL